MSFWKNKKKGVVVDLPKAETPTRTLEEIQTAYAAVCQKAGQCWYHLQCLEADLETFNRQMRELNQEAAVLKQKQAADEAAKNEPKTPPTEESK